MLSSAVLGSATTLYDTMLHCARPYHALIPCYNAPPTSTVLFCTVYIIPQHSMLHCPKFHSTTYCHTPSSYRNLLYYVIPYHTMLYCITLYYYIMLHKCHTVLYYTEPYYTALYYTVLYYTILHHTTLRCTITTLFYTMLYIMLHYSTFHSTML